MLLRVIRKDTPLWLMAFCLSTIAFGQQYNQDFRNRLAPFVTSPQRAVDKMLEMAGLKPGETLYDLGCGDGRILIAAAKRYHVKAVGIEISERLVKKAEDNVKSDGLEGQVKIIHGDFMKADLSDADVVTLYLMTAANEKLRPDLEKHLKKDTRVLSYDYPIPGWTPVNQEETDPSRYGNRHTIYLYQVPTSFKK
jgi:ubiquinone/menaquinone biosynthesis C-methylase UbiE